MIKIAVTGPESTGKTRLTKELSEALNAVRVDEFARKWLEETGKMTQYTFDDVCFIAREQHQQISSASGLDYAYLVSDTDLVVIKVWMEVVFGKVAPEVESMREKEDFDLYLLCSPDLPWEADKLRENPDDRDVLFEKYLAILKAENKPYAVVSGSGNSRLECALQAVALISET